MRGTRIDVPLVHDVDRIIPAYAGNTKVYKLEKGAH